MTFIEKLKKILFIALAVASLFCVGMAMNGRFYVGLPQFAVGFGDSSDTDAVVMRSQFVLSPQVAGLSPEALGVLIAESFPEWRVVPEVGYPGDKLAMLRGGRSDAESLGMFEDFMIEKGWSLVPSRRPASMEFFRIFNRQHQTLYMGFDTVDGEAVCLLVLVDDA